MEINGEQMMMVDAYSSRAAFCLLPPLVAFQRPR